MRPGDGVDAVHLHKADPVDQVMQGLTGGGAGRGLGQGVTMQKQATRAGVGDQVGHPKGVAPLVLSANAGNAAGRVGKALEKAPRPRNINTSSDKVPCLARWLAARVGRRPERTVSIAP